MSSSQEQPTEKPLQGEGEVADDHGNQEAATVENIRPEEEENHHADVHDENEDHDHQQEEEIDQKDQEGDDHDGSNSQQEEEQHGTQEENENIEEEQDEDEEEEPAFFQADDDSENSGESQGDEEGSEQQDGGDEFLMDDDDEEDAEDVDEKESEEKSAEPTAATDGITVTLAADSTAVSDELKDKSKKEESLPVEDSKKVKTKDSKSKNKEKEKDKKKKRADSPRSHKTNSKKSKKASSKSRSRSPKKQQCCSKCKKSDKGGKTCACIVPASQRRSSLGASGCQTCGCKGCSREDQDPRYHAAKAQTTHSARSPSPSGFEAKNGCCKNCLKAFSKSGKACLCQVPERVRKTALSKSGCKYCGCHGCNPEDTRNAPSLDENKKSMVSQQNSTNRRDRDRDGRSTNRLSNSRGRDRGRSRSEESGYSRRAGHNHPVGSSGSSEFSSGFERSGVLDIIQKDLKIYAPFVGYMVPQRTYSYIMGKPPGK